MNILRFGILPTPLESAMGRIMRGPDHSAVDAPAEAAAPAAEAAPAVVEEPKEITAEDLEKEFGQVEPEAAPAEDPAAKPVEGDPAPKEEPAPPAPPAEDAVARQIREANEAAAAAREDAAHWRGVAEGRGKEPPAATQQEEEGPPNPENYDFGEADAKFIADLAGYSARQAYRQEQQQAELRGQFATLEANWHTNVAKVVETYPDFQEKVIAAADKGEWDCPPLIAVGIKQSEHGPDIAYELATNKAEATRIARLSPIEQAREFGIKEGRHAARKEALAAAKAAEAAAPAPTAKVSSAPTPPAHQVRGAGGRFAVEADTGDFSAFEKMADDVLKAK